MSKMAPHSKVQEPKPEQERLKRVRLFCPSYGSQQNLFHGPNQGPLSQQQPSAVLPSKSIACAHCLKSLEPNCTHSTEYSVHPRANIACSPSQLSSRAEAATPRYLPTFRNSNEAGFHTVQAMESSGAGAHVALAQSISVPDSTSLEQLENPSSTMTTHHFEMPDFSLMIAKDDNNTSNNDNTAPEELFDMSHPPISLGPVASNERESAMDKTDTGAHVDDASPAPAPAIMPIANDLISVTGMGDASTFAPPNVDPSQLGEQDTSTVFPKDWNPDVEPIPENIQPQPWNSVTEAVTSASEPEQPNPADMTGYAQLVFPDGEYILTSTSVSLGRDPNVFKQYRRMLQRGMIAETGRERAAQRTAEEALSEYRKEPSQPSQHGGDPSSNSSHSLEGRPAPGLPSNFSEQGGIVSMEKKSKKKKRHKFRHLSGQSSSTNSVVPANLHTFTSYNDAEDGTHIGADGQVTPFVPVHSTKVSDITKISREHLLIRYNQAERRWELEVMGNTAYVRSEHCFELAEDPEGGETTSPKLLSKGAVVQLSHNAEIIVSSLTIKFRLPSGKAKSTFDSDSESDEASLLETPARRLSNAMDNGGSDEEDLSSEEEVALASVAKDDKKKKPKKARRESKGKSGLKLKLKARKASDAGPAPKESPDASKKLEKGKKPKKSVPAPDVPSSSVKPEDPTVTVVEPSNPPVQTQPAMETTVSTEPSPQVPITYEPGSMLGDVPQDQLPEKRKGPGRPPKNGLISKRDMGLIKRKQKEYDKLGIPWPTLDEMVKIVRAENKIKEAAQKAAQRGEAPPATPSGGNQVMQSIEMTDAQLAAALTNATNAPSASMTTPVKQTTEDAAIPGSADGLDAESKAELKRQRTYKSPSPMKPKEECTEEELKKPAHTYYHTLDEILSEGPTEGLELQQIYDKVCKKYPYFKYVVDGHGWQSSVRHNLKQHDRFLQVTKQGKGWLWAINPDIPFDKEKKRKPTPPPQAPRPQMPYPVQNGQMQQQYGAPQYGYGNPYGPANGQQAYQQQPQQGTQPGASGDQYASPYGQPGQNQPFNTQASGQQGYVANTNQPSYPYHQQPHPQQGNAQQGYQLNGTANQQPYSLQSGVPGGQRMTSSTPQPDQKQEIGTLVEEIMAYRAKYLSQWPVDLPVFKEHETLFMGCVNWISEVQLGQTPSTEGANDEQKLVYGKLHEIMASWERRKATVDAHNTKVEAAAGSHTHGTGAAPQGQAPTQSQGPPPVGTVPPPTAQMGQASQAQTQARNDVVSGAFNPVQPPMAQKGQRSSDGYTHPPPNPVSRPSSTQSGGFHAHPTQSASSATQASGGHQTAPAQQHAYPPPTFHQPPAQYHQQPQVKDPAVPPVPSAPMSHPGSVSQAPSKQPSQQPSQPPAGSLTYSPAPPPTARVATTSSAEPSVIATSSTPSQPASAVASSNLSAPVGASTRATDGSATPATSNTAVLTAAASIHSVASPAATAPSAPPAPPVTSSQDPNAAPLTATAPIHTNTSFNSIETAPMTMATDCPVSAAGTKRSAPDNSEVNLMLGGAAATESEHDSKRVKMGSGDAQA